MHKHKTSFPTVFMLCITVVFLAKAITISASDYNAIREQVYQDYPELRNETISDWNKIRIIRTWTWSRVNMAWPPYMFDSQAEWKSLDAGGCLNWFATKYGGVWCQGAAQTLIHMYRTFGFTACMLSATMLPPEKEWGNHAMTLVRINHEGKKVWSLQDAYFNNGVADQHDKPVDYVEFLGYLKAHQQDRVKLLGFDVPVKSWPSVFIPPEKRGGKNADQLATEYWSVDPNQFKTEELSGGWLKISSPRSFALYEERFYYFKYLLKANHLPPESVYFFLYSKQSVSGAPESRNLMLEVQKTISDVPPLNPISKDRSKVWYSTSGYRELPWRWSRMTSENEVASLILDQPGPHIVSVWMRQHGVRLDQIALTQNPSFRPQDSKPLVSGPDLLVIEAEKPDANIKRSDCFWQMLRQGKKYSGDGFIAALPRDGKGFLSQNYEDSAPELQYTIDFPKAGKWFVWIRENCHDVNAASVYLGLNGKGSVSLEFLKFLPQTDLTFTQKKN